MKNVPGLILFILAKGRVFEYYSLGLRYEFKRYLFVFFSVFHVYCSLNWCRLMLLFCDITNYSVE